MNLDDELSVPIPGCDIAVVAGALDRHGDVAAWRAAFEMLPDVRPTRVEFNDRITIGATTDLTSGQHRALVASLRAFHPWRKGPFALFGEHIDTEWRSDWKWARVRPHIASLESKRVLDVGCGNGYFGWRMLEAGARCVLGVDPTQVFLMQHLVTRAYIHRAGPAENYLLPLTFEALPESDPFDVAFSMGVLYHRRDPIAHLRGLKARLAAGGELVLETLITRGNAPLFPSDRYARMRNVHAIPDCDTLLQWFDAAGFTEARIVDVNQTSVSEQRPTAWMTFESLESALDPVDANRTIEGHPAPVRAVVIAHG